MTDKEIKIAIQTSLKAFANGNLFEKSIAFFKTLGYETKRQDPFKKNTFKFFKETFLDKDSRFNEGKAVVKNWQSIDLLFQLTADEISKQLLLFDTSKVDDTIIESYLFFALELTNQEYTRTALAQITREINKVFSMPVMVVFKYGDNLTLSVINRRLNKKDEQLDVLAKVTLIKDISTITPHRAHIEILFDLAFERLNQVHKVKNFVELHNAWQKTLDTKELNKRFYRELSTWYFWAMKEVDFPTKLNEELDKTSILKKEDQIKEHNAKSLIRLLTRILFIWFIKEKNLIPEELFDENYISNNLINDFEPRKVTGFDHKSKGSKYYRAILQNLFFATLNQTADKREFRKENQNMNVTNLMRYESYFKKPKEFVELVEEVVPFMNGGLFECLDSPDPLLKGKKGGDLIIYEDGFSDRKDNRLCVPDYIFFGKGEHADLSEELDDKKQKDVMVNGLIHILKSYKFTITENTPIEEDIALDPELLGHVFENLLASYNPETKTTARKQTGSFYTPREIVNYMVDESLKLYLKQKLELETNISIEDADIALEFLFGYNEKEHLFDEAQTNVLINAIDTCKVLDPACGSGAFPMGVLHKLVHILHKLDPQNKLWKERQIEKANEIDDSKIREDLIEDIETAFNNNELDYGRKLYLIENCIYGVDIQPIAIQISKLRFFISLIVDQKSKMSLSLREKVNCNFGIRPLPNLETKFVAANTLIGIEKELSFDENIHELEEKLKDVRHRLFSAKTPNTKRKLREQDQSLRKEMASSLESSGWDHNTADKLVAWDPFNQNVSSNFFDSEWMFGITDGFDLVIGNPPYIKEYSHKNAFNGARESCYYQGKMDIWYIFACKALDMSKPRTGLVCFIATNNWTTSSGASKLRNKIIGHSKIEHLIDFGSYMIFETADIQTMIMLFKNDNAIDNYKFKLNRLVGKNIEFNDVLDLIVGATTGKTEYLFPIINKNSCIDKTLTFNNDNYELLLNKIASKSNFIFDEKYEIAQGIVIPQDYLNNKNQISLGKEFCVGQGIFVLSDNEKNSLKPNEEELKLLKPYFTSEQLHKWSGLRKNKEWLIYTDSKFKYTQNIKPYPNFKKHLDLFKKVITSDNKPYGLHRSREENFFVGEKIIVLRKCSVEPIFTYTDFDCYVSATFYVIKSSRINLKYLTAILNSKLVAFWLRRKGKMQGNNFQLDKEPLLNIPIYNANENEVAKVVLLVDQILVDKVANTKMATSKIERQIDEIVYKLYELSNEEIKMIEES